MTGASPVSGRLRIVVGLCFSADTLCFIIGSPIGINSSLFTLGLDCPYGVAKKTAPKRRHEAKDSDFCHILQSGEGILAGLPSDSAVTSQQDSG